MRQGCTSPDCEHCEALSSCIADISYDMVVATHEEELEQVTKKSEADGAVGVVT
jgi:hypothetical protein